MRVSHQSFLSPDRLGRLRRLLGSQLRVQPRGVLSSWLAAAVRFIQRISDYIFGYDVFISYSWQDGVQYSRDLADKLSKLRFSVFIDVKEYVAGIDLVPSTQRRVRMSRHLVLILRPKSSVS